MLFFFFFLFNQYIYLLYFIIFDPPKDLKKLDKSKRRSMQLSADYYDEDRYVVGRKKVRRGRVKKNVGEGKELYMLLFSQSFLRDVKMITNSN